jgi:hypothetical protein
MRCFVRIGCAQSANEETETLLWTLFILLDSLYSLLGFVSFCLPQILKGSAETKSVGVFA